MHPIYYLLSTAVILPLTLTRLALALVVVAMLFSLFANFNLKMNARISKTYQNFTINSAEKL